MSTRLFPQLIPVKNIRANSTELSFDASKIESMATAIISAGGLAKPLIVKQIGKFIDYEYELINGHFEYCACMQAYTLSKDFEMCLAFVVPQSVYEVEKTPDQCARIAQGITAQTTSTDGQEKKCNKCNDLAATDAENMKLTLENEWLRAKLREIAKFATISVK